MVPSVAQRLIAGPQDSIKDIICNCCAACCDNLITRGSITFPSKEFFPQNDFYRMISPEGFISGKAFQGGWGVFPSSKHPYKSDDRTLASQD